MPAEQQEVVERVFDDDGFDAEGFDRWNFDRDGFDRQGLDIDGYNRDGFDTLGLDRDGFDRDGYNGQGFDRDGYNRDGYDGRGFDREGRNSLGFDREGYDREGFDANGANREGFDRQGRWRDHIVGGDESLGSQKIPRVTTQLTHSERRPVRMTSIEMEFASGTREAARALTRAGIRCERNAPNPSTTWCYWKEDGSCDGEIVFDRLLLDQKLDSDVLTHALRVLDKKRRERRDVRVSTKCGVHIHVDMQGTSMSTVESLYHLFKYLEDVLYGIASANWELHRMDAASNRYANPIPKGGKGARQIGQLLTRDRYYGMNLSPYLEAMRECGCGAHEWGTWEECTCRLTKPTVEFRLFNTTTNPRKMLAFVALCQSLVAAAQTYTFTEEEFPTMAKDAHLDHRHAATQAERKKRVEFILTRLPLSPKEREAIAYCVLRNYQFRGDKEAERWVARLLTKKRKPIVGRTLSKETFNRGHWTPREGLRRLRRPTQQRVEVVASAPF